MSPVESGFAISTWSRVLAVVFLAAMGLTVWAMLVPAEAAGAGWSVEDALLLLFGSWMSVLFGYAAWTGREPPELLYYPASLWRWLRGTHPERAGPAEIARLRRLRVKAGVFTSVGEARRKIGLVEGRLPPTLLQQRELARYRPQQAIMTRASAERFLAERAGEEAWAEIAGWWEGWLEAGVEIEGPQVLTPREREAFDAASAALHRAGVDYPLPPVLPAFEIVAETARMQLALDLPGALGHAQRDLFTNGVTRRELSSDELRAFITPLLDIWRREPEFDWAPILMFLIARDRPALLVDPWAAREWVAGVEEMLRGDEGEDEEDEEEEEEEEEQEEQEEKE